MKKDNVWHDIRIKCCKPERKEKEMERNFRRILKGNVKFVIDHGTSSITEVK